MSGTKMYSSQFFDYFVSLWQFTNYPRGRNLYAEYYNSTTCMYYELTWREYTTRERSIMIHYLLDSKEFSLRSYTYDGWKELILKTK